MSRNRATHTQALAVVGRIHARYAGAVWFAGVGILENPSGGFEVVVGLAPGAVAAPFLTSVSGVPVHVAAGREDLWRDDSVHR